MKVVFYLYFDSKKSGKNAISVLEKEKFNVISFSILEFNGKKQWSLNVGKSVISEDEIEKMERELEEICLNTGGEYDGYDSS